MSHSLPDEILPNAGEPCESCKGIAETLCYDGKRRCYPCMDRVAKRQGWGNKAVKPSPEPEPKPEPPKPKKKKKVKPEDWQQGLF